MWHKNNNLCQPTKKFIRKGSSKYKMSILSSPFGSANASFPSLSSIFQKSQSNPFFLQQRQYYQQPPPPHYYPNAYHDEQLHHQTNDDYIIELEDISSSTTSESPLIGDLDEINGSDYSYYFFMRGPTDGAFGIGGSNQLTTPYPLPDYGDSTSSYLLENIWNVFDQQFMRHSLGWTITLVVAYMIILIVGVIGNCMVILVVVFRPQMRTVTNMFIMNLAVADLFVIVFCVPATLLANVFTPWILGSFMCKGVAYVQGVSVCASAYSLAAISLDRCKAIYRPMERPKGLSKSQALSTICFIWIIALLLTIPWAVMFNVILSDKDGLSYCLETWKNENHGKIYFLVANLIFCYSLPLILISVSNVIIWCHISHRKVPQDSASEGPIKRMHRRTRHGVRKMLGIVTLAFLLSWLPLYILVTRVKFSKNISDTESDILDILLPLAQWLGSWNSSINPVLYAFLNSKFRESFKSLLPVWIPFVHRNDGKAIIMKNNIAMTPLTNNATFAVGHSGTPSYTTVYTAKSSPRSPNNNSGAGSPRFSYPQSNYHNQTSLTVNNNLRPDYPTVVIGTSSPTNISANSTILTTSFSTGTIANVTSV